MATANNMHGPIVLSVLLVCTGLAAVFMARVHPGAALTATELQPNASAAWLLPPRSKGAKPPAGTSGWQANLRSVPEKKSKKTPSWLSSGASGARRRYRGGHGPMARSAVMLSAEADEAGELAAAPMTAMRSAPAAKSMAGMALGGATAAAAANAPARSQSPLRAGATDDNAAPKKFAEYLQGALPGCERCARLDVASPLRVLVLDAAGAPVAGAHVAFFASAAPKRPLWLGRTYGDGVAPIFPRLVPPGAKAPLLPPSGELVVEVAHPTGGGTTALGWEPAREGAALTVRLPRAEPAAAAVALDVAFVIDATGSMADEIAQIQSTLLQVTSRLRAVARRPLDLRFGAVVYRDRGDEYITRTHPFTADVRAFETALRQVSACCGGDMPESLNEALVTAMGELEWRPNAAAVGFVIADAPPHLDYGEPYTYAHAALAALHAGVRLHCVAASGLDATGTLVFRQVAQLTRAKFIFVEYGSTAAAMAQHKVKGAVESNNLDQIILTELVREVEGWGRRGEPPKAAA
jgi:hypothetical protein